MATGSKGYNLTITLNNFNLSYDDVGEGTIPIIFLHGFPFDKSMWHSQLEFLKSSYRVIAYDLRGFGKSTDEESPLSMDLFSEDLIWFMDKLNIDKAIICGLSMGGYIALNAQNRFPTRIEALVLCDTQCIADTPEAKEKRYKTIDEIKVDGLVNFTEGFIKKVFHKDSFISKKDVVEQLKAVVSSNSPQIISNGLKALAERQESCSTLSDVHIPTLIICGKDDELTPVTQSEYMHKGIKWSVLRVIANAGHVSNLEQPNEFNKYLGDFLTTLGGKDSEELNFKHKSVK